MDQQYDAVVLGFDEESQATVQSLRDQGKRVLYIPVDPRTWVTIMAQTQVNVMETTDIVDHLQVQQQHMCTSMHDTTTYLLQPFVQPATAMEQSDETATINDKEEDTIVEVQKEDEVIFSDEIKSADVPFEFAHVDTENKEQEMDEETSPSAEEEEEQLEEEAVETEETISVEEQSPTEEEFEDEKATAEEEEFEEQDQVAQDTEQEEDSIEQPAAATIEEQENSLFYGPTVTPLTKESSLIDDRVFGIRGTRGNLFSHHLFNPIRIENEDEQNVEQTSDETENIEQNDLHLEDNTASEELTSPLNETDEEVEQTSPKFIFHGPPPEAEEQKEEQKEEQPEETTEEIKAEEKPDEEVVEEKVEAKHEDVQPEQITEKANVEQETVEEDTTPFRRRKKFSFQSLQPESKQEEELERFSPRRRNKKNRLFSSLDITSSVTPKPAPTTTKSEKTFSSLIQDSIIPQESEDPEPKNNEEDKTEQNEEETTTENNELSADNLKIDNIEFEEPYGYNSFEDFFPSFSSSNDRKRQELDKIEKRKIALRGLHNLINNLG